MSNIKQNLSKAFVTLTMVVLFLVLQVSTLFAHERLPKEVPPHNSNYYIDELDILSSETKQIINSRSRKLDEQDGTQVFVLTVDGLDEDPQSYAEKALKSYKLGNAEKDNGLLIMLARLTNGHHRVQVVTGYGLEGILPDGKVGRIIDNYMMNYFEKQEYDKAMLSGYNMFVEVLENPDTVVENTYGTGSTSGDIVGIFFLMLLFLPKLFVGILIILWSIFKGICYIVHIYPKRFFYYLRNRSKMRKLNKGEVIRIPSQTSKASHYYSNYEYNPTFKIIDGLLYSAFAEVSLLRIPFIGGGNFYGGGGFSGGGFSGGGGSTGGGGAGRSF